MDPLRRDDVERARRTLKEAKAAELFDTFRMGLALKRAGLRKRHPEESDAEIDDRVRRWLLREDDA